MEGERTSAPPRSTPLTRQNGMYDRAHATRHEFDMHGLRVMPVEGLVAVPCSDAMRRRGIEVTRPLPPGKSAQQRSLCEGTVRCPRSGADAWDVVCCPTCNRYAGKCDGHWQWFELARLMFEPKGLHDLQNVLRAFHAVEVSRAIRLGALAARDPSEPTGDTPEACALARRNPKLNVSKVKIKATTARQGVRAFKMTYELRGGQNPDKIEEVWSAERVRDELAWFWDASGVRVPRPESHFEMLGFRKLPGEKERPRWAWASACFFAETVLVPPYTTRQSNLARTANDTPDMTSKFNALFVTGAKSQFEPWAAARRDEPGSPEKAEAEIEERWLDFVDDYHTIILLRAPNAGQDGRPPQHAFPPAVHGKKKLLRIQLSQRRDNVSRGVIGPSDVGLGVVAMPLLMMNGLTTSEMSTEWNLQRMKREIVELSYRPGDVQLYMPPPGGTPDRENLFAKHSRDAVRDFVSGLVPGTIVTRSLINGDGVMFNRQPTLLEQGMLAFTCVLGDRPHVISFNGLECPRYNADFDGDEMNIFVQRWRHLRLEGLALASSQRRALERRGGGPALSWTQDSMVGFHLASKPGARVPAENVPGLLRRVSEGVVIAFGRLVTRRAEWVAARDLLSACVVAHLGQEYHYSHSGELCIRAGRVVKELTMSQLARNAHGLLVHAIRARGYGPALAFLEDTDKICCDLAGSFGASLHFQDYALRLKAKAACLQLALAMRDAFAASAWSVRPQPDDDLRYGLLSLALRNLLLVPFGVPEDRWDYVAAEVARAAQVTAPVGAGGDVRSDALDAHAERVFAAALVDMEAETKHPVDIDRAMAYGVCMLQQILRAEGGSERGAGEGFVKYASDLKDSAATLIKSSLHELHWLKTYLVHAISKNKGQITAANAPIGCLYDKNVTIDAFPGRPSISFARGSASPASAGYGQRGALNGLEPGLMRMALAHARHAGIKSTAEVSGPGEFNKVGNMMQADTHMGESGNAQDQRGPISIAPYEDCAARDDLISFCLVPGDSLRLPATARGIPVDRKAMVRIFGNDDDRKLRLSIPFVDIYDDLQRAAHAGRGEGVPERAARAMVAECAHLIESFCWLPGRAGRKAGVPDRCDDTPRGTYLFPVLAAVWCVFDPSAMHRGGAPAAALRAALVRAAREYRATRASPGENIGTAAVLAVMPGLAQSALNASHASNDVTNVAFVRHVFFGQNRLAFVTFSVTVAESSQLAAAASDAVAWFTAKQLKDVADMFVPADHNHRDMWSRSVAGRFPGLAMAVLTPRAAGWTAGLLRDAVLENRHLGKIVEDFVASDLPVVMRHAAAPRLAVFVQQKNMEKLKNLFAKEKVGLLKSVSRPRGASADPSGKSMTLGGFVADKTAARSPLRAVLEAADRLHIDPDSVRTTNPRDQLHVRGASAFRGSIVSILDGVFADVDEAHARLLADWMVAGRLRTYTESSLDRLTAMFFRRTEPAVRTATIAGAECRDSMTLKSVIMSEPQPRGTCFCRIEQRG